MVEKRIARSPSWDIWYANNRPLRTIGSLEMPVRLGHFVTLGELIFLTTYRYIYSRRRLFQHEAIYTL